MANICSSTPIRDTSIKGLTAELNFIRSTICTLQSQVANGASLPIQGGHAGEFLTTDGSTASWTPVSGGPTIYTGDGDIPIGTTRTVGVYSHLTDNTILDFIAKNEETDTFPYAKIRIIGGNTGDAEPSISIFTTDETGGSMSVTYYDGIVTYSDTKAEQTAIQYGGDYSGSPAFTARSIPDKGYVDGKFSGGATKGPFTSISSITVVNGLVTDLQGT